MTSSEAIMWDRLRGRRLGGFKFYRQHVIKDYIVDFFNNDALLVVEIDGSVHANRDIQIRDEERCRALAHLGYNMIRFTSTQVEVDTELVCETILNEVYRRIDAQLPPTTAESEPLSG